MEVLKLIKQCSDFSRDMLKFITKGSDFSREVLQFMICDNSQNRMVILRSVFEGRFSQALYFAIVIE